jgi:hypothetical protein
MAGHTEAFSIMLAWTGVALPGLPPAAGMFIFPGVVRDPALRVDHRHLAHLAAGVGPRAVP